MHDDDALLDVLDELIDITGQLTLGKCIIDLQIGE